MCKIGSPLLSFLLCSLCTPLQQLKDTQNLSGLDELEIKDSVDVGYEYLNPDVNLGKTEKLPEWDDYIQKYIPLEIVKEIIKR